MLSHAQPNETNDKGMPEDQQKARTTGGLISKRCLCQGYIYSLGARRLCIDETIHTKDRVLGEEVLRGAEGSELYAILAEIEISSRISLMDSSSDSSSAGE